MESCTYPLLNSSLFSVKPEELKEALKIISSEHKDKNQDEWAKKINLSDTFDHINNLNFICLETLASIQDKATKNNLISNNTLLKEFSDRYQKEKELFQNEQKKKLDHLLQLFPETKNKEINPLIANERDLSRCRILTLKKDKEQSKEDFEELKRTNPFRIYMAPSDVPLDQLHFNKKIDCFDIEEFEEDENKIIQKMKNTIGTKEHKRIQIKEYIESYREFESKIKQIKWISEQKSYSSSKSLSLEDIGCSLSSLYTKAYEFFNEKYTNEDYDLLLQIGQKLSIMEMETFVQLNDENHNNPIKTWLIQKGKQF